MDASASPKVDADFREVYGFFFKIEGTEFPTPDKQRSTVIKYTKLPEFEGESWQSYKLKPRLRRIITLESAKANSPSSRSLDTDKLKSKPMAAVGSHSKRKIVTISEDDEYDLHPKFSKGVKKSSSNKNTNRSMAGEIKEQKQVSHRSTSRLTTLSKYSKEIKPSAKTNNATDRKEVIAKSNYTSKNSNVNYVSIENVRSRNAKDRETVRNTKSVASSRTSVNKNDIKPSVSDSENEVSIIRTKLYDNLKISTKKKSIEIPQANRSPLPQKSKVTFLKEIQNKRKPMLIHVPLEEKQQNKIEIVIPITCEQSDPAMSEVAKSETEIPCAFGQSDTAIVEVTKSDCGTDTEIILHKDMTVGTDPLPKTVDQVTQMDCFQPDVFYECVETDIKTEVIKKFDDLDIPNVTLTQDRSSKDDSDLHSKSLPNLKIPKFSIAPTKHEKALIDASYCKSTSYIIGRAKLTYTTKQKINFQVVGSNENAYSNQPPSLLTYPMNVVSVFKKQKSSKDYYNNITRDDNTGSKEIKNCINEIKSHDCSYVSNNNKLMKPSDIISTITVNNGLSQSEYACEQFQRELNFIDSFFESLQYLENCSLSDNCFNNGRIDQLVQNPSLLETEFDIKHSEYDGFLSRLENGANVDETETLASKNLFLLNILIRNEQRRADNLLCVLKRREEALKDFTKSQILYLENKKKQDNTDISALKKKQRGALLKLQHECGEMQRMRKALLTLSEKRKVALMKTKKDLELKLRNNVDVEQIILGKKKLKRTAADRSSAPLKCFDLSSSGCEDSATSRCYSEPVPHPEAYTLKPATGVEKSIQTGDSILETTSVDASTDTAAENFVVVDGRYLNILFHNLSLPHMFSSGKQYEVNEEALRNVVSSTNTQNTVNSNVVEKLMDQIKNRDLDQSSTPSTARSLVEEFNQYYKGLTEDEKSDSDRAEKIVESDRQSKVFELSDAMVQVSDCMVELPENFSCQSASTMTSDSTETVIVSKVSGDCLCDPTENSEELLSLTGASLSVPGPLPVPVGACDVTEPVMATLALTEAPAWPPPSVNSALSESSSASSESLCERASSISSLTLPAPVLAHCEAEELRRQQLAIEREIKELEQQQCRLLVVREIPDKPPPPYTPPSEVRVKPPRCYRPDDVNEDRIWTFVSDTTHVPSDAADAFDVFVRDFCQESRERHKPESSDKPWDTCNLLPQKPPVEPDSLVRRISTELVDVLTGVTPSLASGVSSRRSDHIDDILFEEWRRVEPAWTSLHADEAVVKNQLFENIFQRILNETVDEYKRTVLTPRPQDAFNSLQHFTQPSAD